MVGVGCDDLALVVEASMDIAALEQQFVAVRKIDVDLARSQIELEGSIGRMADVEFHTLLQVDLETIGETNIAVVGTAEEGGVAFVVDNVLDQPTGDSA